VTYSIWQELAPLLAPHFQLILVELPGMTGASLAMTDKPYYESCAEMLEELRIALGFERWAIFAYSTGTRASEAYVRCYPQRVIRAVFLCPIYLTPLWMTVFQVAQWVNARSGVLANWFISGWRLYGWLLVVGFNLYRRACVRDWMREIEQRPIETLKRMLLELPERGRAPFRLPDFSLVPSLFIWARHDRLVAYPTHPCPHDVFLPTSHGGAPVLMPEEVAEVTLPFLKGKQRSSHHLTQVEKEKRSRFKMALLLFQSEQRKAEGEPATPSRYSQ
jgi:pimeloyl-ACP methyl ester carboxylesterase